MQVVLVMFRSDGDRRSFSVVRNMTVIGRREDCDLRIPVGDVSRKHCRLVRTDDGIRIEDLGSSNGTFVNGQRIQESELNAGDLVGVGPVQFIVQIDGIPEDDQITAPAPAFDPEDSGVRLPAAPYAEASTGLSEAGEVEEFPLEEVEEVPAAPAALEEYPIEEAAEFPIEEAPVPAKPVSRRPPSPPPPPPVPEPELEAEVAIEEEPEGELDELHVDAPAGHADSEIEHIALEETAPTTEPKPAEGDWDFVVEEPEAAHGNDDFHIDLDSSAHEQPHK